MRCVIGTLNKSKHIEKNIPDGELEKLSGGADARNSKAGEVSRDKASLRTGIDKLERTRDVRVTTDLGRIK